VQSAGLREKFGSGMIYFLRFSIHWLVVYMNALLVGPDIRFPEVYLQFNPS